MEPSSQPRVVCFGEVLWDILPGGSLPGGAPMNVAYHLNKLGSDPALITRIGTDDYGKKLVNILSAAGVNTEFFQVDYTHPTGLVYANTTNQQDVAYDIVYPSAWDFIEWDDEFEELLAHAEFFVLGSLTSRNKETRETLYRMLEHAKNKVLDINLRQPHFSRSNVGHLLQRTTILKMNEAELELITGWFSRFTNTEDRMKLMQDLFGIQTVIVTMGGDGALVNHNGVLHSHPGFRVDVTDTIGSGDSFLAGFLHSLLRQTSIDEALAFASAMGAFIATHEGACPQYETSQILQLINSNSNQKFKQFHNN